MKKERQIDKIYALTPMQEGMLFHSLKDTDALFYFEQYMFTLKGTINKAFLQESFNRIIKRHDILRTLFVYDKIQKPRQVVIEDLALYIHFEEISHLKEDEQKTYLEEFKKKDRARGFDLTRELLMRVYLFKTGTNLYKLLWSSHHITMDGWSSGIFIKELLQVFCSLKKGENIRFAPAIPFRNYVKWLEKQDKDEGLNYWKCYLEEYEQQATLPKLGNPEEDGSHQAAEYEFKLDEELTTDLIKTAGDQQVTVNIVFQTLWGLLLQKYNNTDDVVFGTVVSGRPPDLESVENMIGLFINAIPVRIETRPLQLFSQLVARVQENAAASKTYEYLPLADVQNLSLLKRELIDHLVTFENYPVEEQMKEAGNVEELGFKIEDIQWSDPINYDFDIIVIPGTSLIVKFSYNRRVYAPDQIKRVGSHFQQLVTEVIKDPDIPVGKIDILTQEEKKQLLKDFNDTESGYPKDKTIHELFEEQVERTPNHISAVSDTGQHLTYRTHTTYKELNKKANQLANYLYFEKQILPGHPVGILMDRNIEHIIAILGVLKAGGAYVPMYASWPEERIKHMITDTTIEMVISQEKHLKRLNRLQWECPSFCSFLCMDTEDNYSVMEIGKDQMKSEKELWNYIGEKAVDEITGGGWLTSYTGEPFTKEEMDEYGDNILKKLLPLLNKEMRILEIGCASGITMYRISPHVEFYYGTDLSSVIIEKNRERIREENIKNIMLACIPAHQIDTIKERNFNLVIINSVIQDFQEHNYLRKVIRKSIDMLAHQGYLFIGDVMDQDLKEHLIREMVEFKETNKGRGFKTKTDFSSELFVSRGFFEDLLVEIEAIQTVEFSDKIFTIENELTKFRYDTLMTIDKNSQQKRKNRPLGKNRHQDDLSTLQKCGSETLKLQVKPENPAYVIYTSGTTGKPNGVLIEHRNVVNLLTWFSRTFHVGTGTHALQLTDYTFDPSVEEVLGTLLYGGVVYGIDRDLTADIDEFCRFVDTHQIQIINFVPSLLEHLLCQNHKLESLRVVISGGEPLKESVKNRIIEKSYLLYNNYGPTEITVDALSTLCSENKVTIGKPVSNTRCYILDGNKKLSPMYVPGELVISGDGVSRGYLNHPELTKQKFNRTYMSYRSYKTGDLARWLPDGNIEFLGRIDHQVKVRGFRIELGEIESLLVEHPRIKEAAVIARGEGEQKTICAYCVSTSENQPELFPSIGEYPLYDELLYFAMTNDELRNKSYKIAINRLVKDKTVVEIGTGQDVVLARFCVEAGAKKVYAIELSEESYKKACQLVKENSLEEKIILIHGNSLDVELPEKVDVCVSEIIGTIGGSEGAAAILNNARRFLKEDGIMIPRKCITKIAAVCLPTLLHQAPGFSEVAAGYVEKLFKYTGYTFDLRICVKQFPISSIISNSEIFEELNFSGIIDEKSNHGIELVINGDTTFDGFLLWINVHTIEEEVIDTLEKEYNWLPLFVPLPYLSVDVSEGDIIKADCIRTLSANSINPDYKIKGVLIRGRGDNIEFACDLPYFEKGFRKTPFYEKLFDEKAVNNVRNGNHNVMGKELRNFLERKLPDYMIPSYFVQIENIPLTSSGKVDRKALPDPELKKGEGHAAPRNDVEKKLVKIWSDVLGVDKEIIGIDSNFFEIGGHSLKATILVSKINKELNVKVPLKEIFRFPYIRKISGYIKGAEEEKYTGIEKSEEKEYYTLSYNQKRLWIIHQLDPDSPSYHMPGMIPLEHNVDVAALEKALSRIFERHESLRTAFKQVGEQPLQFIEKTIALPFKVIDISSLPGKEKQEKKDSIYLEVAVTPFNLSQAPLFRSVLVKSAETSYDFMFNMHHIISDGWSQEVLKNEFTAYYEGYRAGKDVNPEPLKLQYKDFAQWHNRQIANPRLKENSHRFWKGKLDGGIPALQLPVVPGVNKDEKEGAACKGVLSEEIVKKIRNVAEKNNTTLFTVIFSLYILLLSRFAHQEDISCSIINAGRDHEALGDIVGFFVNAVLFRTRVEYDECFNDFLQRVHTEVLEMSQHQAYPLERVCEDLRMRYPDIPVSFNMLNIGDTHKMKKPNIDELPHIPDISDVKFDIELYIAEYKNAIDIIWTYRKNMFHPDSIDFLMKDYIELVEFFSRNPDESYKAYKLSKRKESIWE